MVRDPIASETERRLAVDENHTTMIPSLKSLSLVLCASLAIGACGPAGSSMMMTPTGNNLARGGASTASSIYSDSWQPARLSDGDLATSWFAAGAACASATDGFVCAGLTAETRLSADATLGRVIIRGNREYMSGYTVRTGKVELLNAAGAVLSSTDVVFAPPSNDATVAPAAPVAGVRTIRVTILSADGSGPGLAEIEAYAP